MLGQRNIAFRIKGIIVSWLRLITVQVVLFSAVICFAADPNAQNEQEKTAVSHQTAQDWIQVGTMQYQKGLYEQAHASFLSAKEYQEYLTPDEQKQLDKRIADTDKAVAERQPVLEHIKRAQELLKQGQPIKARAHYEAIRKSPYLTEQERKQIEQEIKIVDSNSDKQRTEITELYNRSVQLYRAGEIEKARDGFVEVARYGMLVVPKGQTAEDYLLQIDSILTEKLKNQTETNSTAPSANGGTPAGNTEQPAPAEPKITPLVPESNKTAPARQGNRLPQANQPQQESVEVAAAAEPQAASAAAEEPKVPSDNETKAVSKEARAKIAQTYTKAVVDDTAKKVEHYIGTGEFDRAIAKIRAATEVVKDNRQLIGDEQFTQYTMRLKQLIDDVIGAKKKSS